jgi:hypothetical protein
MGATPSIIKSLTAKAAIMATQQIAKPKKDLS